MSTFTHMTMHWFCLKGGWLTKVCQMTRLLFERISVIVTIVIIEIIVMVMTVTPQQSRGESSHFCDQRKPLQNHSLGCKNQLDGNFMNLTNFEKIFYVSLLSFHWFFFFHYKNLTAPERALFDLFQFSLSPCHNVFYYSNKVNHPNPTTNPYRSTHMSNPLNPFLVCLFFIRCPILRFVRSPSSHISHLFPLLVFTPRYQP